MFFKRTLILALIFALWLNVICFLTQDYIPAKVREITSVIIFVMHISIFFMAIYHYLVNLKYIKRIRKKLEELKDNDLTSNDKINYRLILKLISHIEKRLEKVEVRNKSLKEENKVIKGKMRVYELMIEQKNRKVSKLFATLKENMEKINTYGREIARIDKVKDNIIAIVSHELRSPLFSSMNYLDVLKSTGTGQLSDLQMGFIEKIEKSLEKIEYVINEMIDINNLSIGSYVTNYEYDDFVKYFRDTVNQYISQVNCFRELSFEIKNETKKAFTYFDKSIIRKIVINLLSNSCRFTPDKGNIKISLSTTTRCSKDFLDVKIQDSGVGIEKMNVYKIFDKFYEASFNDNSILKHTSGKLEFGTRGLGIGLPIVKELVELHGGEIWVLSEGKDKGATFEFLIPIRKKEESSDKNLLNNVVENKT